MNLEKRHILSQVVYPNRPLVEPWYVNKVGYRVLGFGIEILQSVLSEGGRMLCIVLDEVLPPMCFLLQLPEG